MNALSSRASAMALLTSVLGPGAVQPITSKGVDPMPRGPMPKKVRITAGPPEPLTDLIALISVCPGGSHGIFRVFGGDGKVHRVRKPFDAETIN